MKTLADELLKHPFFADLNADYVKLIAGCGVNVVFQPGEIISSEGSDADEFYVIRKGRIAIQMHDALRGAVLLQTLDSGDVLGWSWLFPPYRWSLEAKAMQQVHAIKLDGRCLRAKCDVDPGMGYELMKRFSQILAQRLEATRLQVLDLYGKAK